MGRCYGLPKWVGPLRKTRLYLTGHKTIHVDEVRVFHRYIPFPWMSYV